jgi:hypothetical protein
MFKTKSLVVLIGALIFFSGNVVNAGTTTIKIYSSSGDGSMLTSPYPGTWSNQHDDTTGRNVSYTNDHARLMAGAFYTPTRYLAIERAFLAFDTSIIPDNAQIISAKLHLYPTEVHDEYNDIYSYIAILEGTQSSATTLANSDIDNCGNSIVNPTKGSDNIDITSLSVNNYKSIDLNSTGLGWISKIANTKLCLREGHDIENQETVENANTGTWKESRVNFKTSEASGTSTDPYIEVTYDL